MRLEDLNWMDVEKYLATDDRLMLVLGSCEQHASLSLLTDLDKPTAKQDFTGSELMEKGLVVSIPNQPGAVIITYERG